MGTGFCFDVVNAADYDALRPRYAAEAVAWVAERGDLGAGSLVVDLAAGTGQLSSAFDGRGLALVAVEPAANMRAVFGDRLPDVRVLDGTAESVPLENGAADAIVVGNAFHHFDEERALGEIRRVLRPGGSLALFWARPGDGEYDRYPAMRAIDEAVERARDPSPIVAAYRRWFEPPERAEGFTPFERRSFITVHVLPSARLADLYATSSDVASLDAGARAGLLARIAELSLDLPVTLELPARSVVDLCARAEGGER